MDQQQDIGSDKFRAIFPYFCVPPTLKKQRFFALFEFFIVSVRNGRCAPVLPGHTFIGHQKKLQTMG